MKNNNLKNIFVVVLLFSLHSCIEDVNDVNLPTIDTKMVISSFITPGDSIRIKVSKSTPIFYNQVYTDWESQYYTPLIDATVSISNIETGETKEIPYNPELEYYLLTPSEFPVEKGHEYLLTASAAGLKSISAKTSVPFGTPEIHSLSIDTVYSESYDYGDGTTYEYHDLVVSGYLVDTPNENNYYTVGAFIREEYYSSWDDTTYVYYYYHGGDSFTDLDKDGQDIPFKTYVYINGNSTFSLSLLSTDEHYYRYHKSFYSWDSENPFGEPSPLYSNIDGGLGIFASFSLINLNNSEKENHIFSSYLCRHKR